MNNEKKWCGEMSMLPFFYKGSFTFPCCVLEAGHEGPHETSEAYESQKWETVARG